MWFSSGKTANYLPWDNGEPNNYNSSEHCAAIFHVGKEKWHDVNCISSFNFMCKKKNKLVCEFFIIFFHVISYYSRFPKNK